jgi:hypothetical protein
VASDIARLRLALRAVTDWLVDLVKLTDHHYEQGFPTRVDGDWRRRIDEAILEAQLALEDTAHREASSDDGLTA